MALLSRGMITIPEAAALAGVSRQLVRHWAKRSKVDWRRMRLTKLADAWRKEMGRGTRVNKSGTTT